MASHLCNHLLGRPVLQRFRPHRPDVPENPGPESAYPDTVGAAFSASSVGVPGAFHRADHPGGNQVSAGTAGDRSLSGAKALDVGAPTFRPTAGSCGARV